MGNFFSIADGDLSDSGVLGQTIDSADVSTNTREIKITTAPSAPVYFVANDSPVHSLAVNLSARAANTTSILTLNVYDQQGESVATNTYDINLFTSYNGDNNLITIHPQNWQILQLDTPVSLVEDETYYFTLSSSAEDQISLIGQAAAIDDVSTRYLTTASIPAYPLTPFTTSKEQIFNLGPSYANIRYKNAPDLSFGVEDFTVDGFYYFNAPIGPGNNLNVPVGTGNKPLINFGKGWGKGTYSSWGLLYNATEKQFYLWKYTTRGQSIIYFPYELFANRWYYISVSRKDGVISMWIDGVNVGTYKNSQINFHSLKVSQQELQINNLLQGSGVIHTDMCVSNIRVTKGVSLYYPHIPYPTKPLSDRLSTSLLYRDPYDSTYRVCDRTGSTTLSTFNVIADITNFVDKTSFAYRGTAAETLNTSHPFTGLTEYSLNLDGTTYFQAANSYGTTVTGSFTCEAWINPTNVTGTRRVWSYSTGEDTNASYTFGTDIVDGALRNWVIDGSTIKTKYGVAQGTILTNRWTHIAVTREGRSLTTYIDGVAMITVAIPFKINSPVGCVFKIGGDSFDLSRYIGKITNLRFTNGDTLYTSNFNNNTSSDGVLANISAPVPLAATIGNILYTGELSSVVEFKDISLPNTVYRAYNDAGVSDITPYTVPSNRKSLFLQKNKSQYIDTIFSNTKVAVNIGLSDFTIECWIRLASLPTGAAWYTGGTSKYFCIFSFASPGAVNDGMRIIIDSTAIRFIGFNDDTTPIMSANFTPNIDTWYHIAYVREKGVLACYINGIRKASLFYDKNIGGGSTIAIGKNIDNSTTATTINRLAYFDGYIADLRITRGTAIYTSEGDFITTNLDKVSLVDPIPLEVYTAANNIGHGKLETVRVTMPDRENTPWTPANAGSSYYFPGGLVTSLRPIYGPPAGFHIFGDQDFTVEMWVNLENVTRTQRLILIPTFNYRYNSGIWITTDWHNTPVSIQVEANSTVSAMINPDGLPSAATPLGVPTINSGATKITANNWHRITFTRTYSTNTLNLYIDGALASQVSAAGTGTAWNAGTYQITYIDYAYLGSDVSTLSPVGYIAGIHISPATAITPSAVRPLLPPVPVTFDRWGRLTNDIGNVRPTYLVSQKNNKVIICNAGESASTPYNSDLADGSAVIVTTKQAIPGPSFNIGRNLFCMEMFVYLYPSAQKSQRCIVYFVGNTNAYSNLSIYATVPTAPIGKTQKYYIFLDSATSADGGDVFYSTSDVQYNTWTHIALVRETASIYKFYINGVLDATLNTGLRNLFFNNSDTSRNIIGMGPGPDFPLNGRITGYRVVNGKPIYTANFNISAPPEGVDLVNKIPAITTPETSYYLLAKKATATYLFTPGDAYYNNGSADACVQTETGQLPQFSRISLDIWIHPVNPVFEREIIVGAYGWALEICPNTNGNQSLVADGTLTPAANFRKVKFQKYGRPPTNAIDATTYLVSNEQCINYNEWNHIYIAQIQDTLYMFVNGKQQGVAKSPYLLNYPFDMGGTRYYAQQPYALYTVILFGQSFRGYYSNIHIQDTMSLTALPPINSTSTQTINPSTILISTTANYRYSTSYYFQQTSVFPDEVVDSTITDNSPLFVARDGSYMKYVPVADELDQSSAFTVECWVRFDRWPADTGTEDAYCIFSRSILNQFGVGIDVSAAGFYKPLCLSIIGEKDGGIGRTKLQVKKWYHVAVTYDPVTKFKVYLNNTLEISYTTARAALNFLGTNNGIVAGYKLDGYISNFRITKQVLYTGKEGEPTAPLSLTPNTSILYKSPYTNYSYTELYESFLGATKAAEDTPDTPFDQFIDSSLGPGRYAYIEPSFSPDLYIGTKDFVLEWWEKITSFKDGYFPIILFGGTADATGPLRIYYDTNGTRLMINSTPFILAAAPTLNVWRYRAIVRKSGRVSLYTGSLGSSLTLERAVDFGTDIASIVDRGIVGAMGSSINPVLFYTHNGYLSNIRLTSSANAFSLTAPTAPFENIAGTAFLYKSPYSAEEFFSNNIIKTTALLNIDSPLVFKASPYNDYINDCMFFNNSNFLKIPDKVPDYNIGLNGAPFTLELWIYLLSNADQCIISRGGGVRSFDARRGIAYSLKISSDRIYWEAHTVEAGIGTSHQMLIGGGTASNLVRKWSHIAVTYDGGITKLFINGIAATTTSYLPTGSYDYSNNNRGSFRIGKAVGTTTKDLSTNFYGYISNLRIINGDCLYSNNFVLTPAVLNQTQNTVLLLKSPYPAHEFRSAPSPFSDNIWQQDRIGFNNGAKYLKTSSPIAAMKGVFTIEFWINYSRENFTPEFFLDGRAADTGTPFLLGLNFKKNQLRIYTGANDINCGYILPKIWHHIAIIRNSKNIVSVYINGQIVASFSSTAVWGGNALIIGKQNGVPYNFLGYLSNIRIVNGEAVYTTDFSVPTSPHISLADTSFLLKPALNLNKSIITTKTGVFNPNTSSETYRDCTAYTASLPSPYGAGDPANSIKFDESQFIEYLPNSSLDLFQRPFVIEMWIFNTREPSIDFDINVSYAQSLFLYTNFWIYLDNENKLCFYNGVDTSYSNIEVPMHAWCHIAVACTSTSPDYDLDLFIDGDRVFTWKRKIQYSAINRIALGTIFNNGTTLCPFYGYLSDIRVTVGDVSRDVKDLISNRPLTSIGIQVVSDVPDIVTDSTISSVFFDGSSNSYCDHTVVIPDIATSLGFIIEFWIKADIYTQLRDSATIVQCRDTSTNKGWKIVLYQDNSISFKTSVLEYRTGADVFISGEWIHVAFSMDGNDGDQSIDMKVFINGELSFTDVGGSTGDSANGNKSKLRIGDPSVSFVGYIANLKIHTNTNYSGAEFDPVFTETPLIPPPGSENLSGVPTTVFLLKTGERVTNEFIKEYSNNYITVPVQALTENADTALLLTAPYNIIGKKNAIKGFNVDLEYDPVRDGNVWNFNGDAISLDVMSYPYYRGTLVPFISLESNPNLNLANTDFILEVWVQPTTLTRGVDYYILNKLNEYNLYISGTTSKISFRSPQKTVTSNVLVSVDRWYHILITSESNTVSMYIDGIFQNSVAAMYMPATASYPLIIGAYNTAAGSLRGKIADIRIRKNIHASNVVPVPFDSNMFEDTADTVLTFKIPGESGPAGDFFTGKNIYRNKFREISVDTPLALPQSSPFNNTDSILSFAYDQGIGIPSASQNDLSNAEWTFEAWIFNENTRPREQHILYKGDSSSNYCYRLLITGTNVLSFAVTEPYTTAKNVIAYRNKTISVTDKLPYNKWAHVCLMSDGKNTSIYINGEWAATAGFAVKLNDESSTIIGAHPFYRDRGFCGYMSNIRLIKNRQVYSGNVNIPVEAHPNSTETDPYYENVSLLLHASGANGSKVLTDSSINNYTVTPIRDTCISTAESKFGNSSIYFYGGDIYIHGTTGKTFLQYGGGVTGQFNDAGKLGTNNFTVEFFIHATTGIPGTHIILDMGGNGNTVSGNGNTTGGINIGYDSATLSKIFVSCNGARLIEVTEGWSLNEWHHIAVCRAGTSLKMYINGIQRGKAVLTANLTNGLNSIGVGSWTFPYGEYTGNPGYLTTRYVGREYGMYGYLDEIRITKNICRYNSSFTVPVSPLPATLDTSILIKSPYTPGEYQMAGEGSSIHISSLISKNVRKDIVIDATADIEIPNLFIHNHGTLNISSADDVTIDITGSKGLQITSEGTLNIT